MGEIGRTVGDRVLTMAQHLGDLPETLATAGARVHSRGGVRHRDGSGLTWSHWPLSASTGGADASAHDVVVIETVGDGMLLRGSTSGALPLYLDIDGDRITFSSSLDALIRTRAAPPSPDWDGLVQMVAASGPMDGRTTVAGIRRLRPGETLTRTADGDVRSEITWAWPEIETGAGSTADLLDALRTSVGRLAREQSLVSMLSGGWDSRLLLALADGESGHQGLQALTTSSDTGTVMEELVAAQVAELVHVPHRIVMPDRSQFAADLADFGAAADYQTAFHIWLVPLARAVLAGRVNAGDEPIPTVLDGLGGGLFIGSSFADDASAGSRLDGRMAGIVRYLPAAPAVLREGLGDRLADRIRADAGPTVHRYLDHPYGHTLTAYLTRTVPGISLAPHALLAGVGPVATPFLSPGVVSAALRMAPAAHADDRLYPLLTSAINPALGALPTAQEQVPWPRPHPRRVTSLEAVRHLRSLLLREPVRGLVAPALIEAGPKHWRSVLSTTGGQHLIRGLGMLSLWCEAYAGLVTGLDLQELTR